MGGWYVSDGISWRGGRGRKRNRAIRENQEGDTSPSMGVVKKSYVRNVQSFPTSAHLNCLIYLHNSTPNYENAYNTSNTQLRAQLTLSQKRNELLIHRLPSQPLHPKPAKTPPYSRPFHPTSPPAKSNLDSPSSPPHVPFSIHQAHHSTSSNLV
jgi:hypothetical protein